MTGRRRLVAGGSIALVVLGLISAGAALAAAGPGGRSTERPVTRVAPPHVMPFATGLHGARRRPGHRRSSVPVPPGLDGCDHSYGGAGQCVPWVFPPGTADRCAWLHRHHLDALPVHGRDRHHLDGDRNGVTCDG